jgi:hypothetical protein
VGNWGAPQQIQSRKSNFWPAAEEKSTWAHELKPRRSSALDRTTKSKEKPGQENRERDPTGAAEKSRAGRNKIGALRLAGKKIRQEKTGHGTDQATRTNTNRRTSWARHRCVLATRVENEERKTRRQTGHTRLKRKRDSSMNKKRSTEIRERAAKSDLAPPNQTSKNTQHTSCKPDFSIKI